MAIRYTAAQLRDMKFAYDRQVADQAIEDLSDDIGDKIIAEAKEGKTTLTAIISSNATNTIITLEFGNRLTPYATYNVRLNKYIIDGCVAALHEAFPNCMICVEAIDMTDTRAIVIDWSIDYVANAANAAASN